MKNFNVTITDRNELICRKFIINTKNIIFILFDIFLVLYFYHNVHTIYLKTEKVCMSVFAVRLHHQTEI